MPRYHYLQKYIFQNNQYNTERKKVSSIHNQILTKLFVHLGKFLKLILLKVRNYKLNICKTHHRIAIVKSLCLLQIMLMLNKL